MCGDIYMRHRKRLAIVNYSVKVAACLVCHKLNVCVGITKRAYTLSGCTPKQSVDCSASLPHSTFVLVAVAGIVTLLQVTTRQ